MNDKPLESWRVRASVAEALDVFNASYMQEVWSKALARRQTDPEGAVTTARTLLESVCKHILESGDVHVRDGLPLPQLYAETAKLLEIAPSENLAPVFNTMFTACSELIAGIGKLRNELSDSHGRGQFGKMPEWRHSELAVNLSGAMATYLAAVWAGRQPTVANVIESYLEDLKKRKRKAVLPHPITYAYARMRSDLGHLIAANLRVSDVVGYLEDRVSKDTVSPATIKKEYAMLRVALGKGRSPVDFRKVAEILRQRNLVPRENRTHLKRMPQADMENILAFLREHASLSRSRKHHGATNDLVDIVEFAIWTGRKPVDMFRLRWSDVDFKKRMCKLPDDTESFPVLERAWEIVEKRRPDSFDANARIFPYTPIAVQTVHRNAVYRLVELGKLADVPRFHDYAYEAIYRLLEKNYPTEVVARATGHEPGRVLKIAHEVRRA